MVPESSSAAPSGKLLHVDSARPQLRDAFKSLEAAYDALKAADETHHIAWTLWGGHDVAIAGTIKLLHGPPVT
jgi:hypothetical protein